MDVSIEDQDWAVIADRIGRAIDLEGTARSSGVLRRKRRIRSGSDLLRLALAYGPGGQSLRQTAAWSQLQGVASLSDVGLMYRLRSAADWLGEVASGLLARRDGEGEGTALPQGLRLRVLDASTISPPGKGPRWRLHALYDVAEERFSQLELCGWRTAETLEHARVGSGDLVIGDRVYARPGGLRHVAEAGGDFLARLGRRSLRLDLPDGEAFDLAAVLDESDRTGWCDLAVRVLDGGDAKRPPLPARLVVLKKPPDAAEAARQKALRASQRGGHANDPVSLRAAEHLMLITSLDRERASPEQLGGLYRLRWRIELAFKRMKSLLHIDRLPAKDEGLARTWIFAHLIVALLIEDLSPHLRDSSP
jgi:hypothetical protein